MKIIKQYVKERDEAIIECWKQDSVEPLDAFIDKNKETIGTNVNEEWQNAPIEVKWLTICNMTMAITNKDVSEYIDNVASKRDEIKKRI